MLDVNERNPMAATAPEYLRVLACEKVETAVCLLVGCADFEAYRALPDVVRFDGQVFGLTGWDSDRQWACYRSDAALAEALRGAA